MTDKEKKYSVQGVLFLAAAATDYTVPSVRFVAAIGTIYLARLHKACDEIKMVRAALSLLDDDINAM